MEVSLLFGQAAEPAADVPVQAGQVVRVDYQASLDDGTVVASSTASFRIGKPIGRVICAVVEEVVVGMRLGDTRRVRAPPSAPRGRAIFWRAPRDEFLEYDVTLTGVVAQRKILTVDQKQLLHRKPESSGLQRVIDTVLNVFGLDDRGANSLARLAALAGLDGSNHHRGGAMRVVMSSASRLHLHSDDARRNVA